MKKIIVYTNEIFDGDVLVCVGVTAEQIKKWADKNSKNLKEIFKIKNNFDIIKENIIGNNGFVVVFVKNGISFYLLWLKDYKNSWKEIDTLNHEVVHLRQAMFESKKIINEREFEAYFQESTLRGIRKKLIKL